MPEQHPQMADIPMELAPEMVSAALSGVAQVPSAGHHTDSMTPITQCRSQTASDPMTPPC